MAVDMKEEFAKRADRVNYKNCPLCLHKLDADKDKMGVVEFLDGYFWVCNKCMAKLGESFDCRKQKDWGAHETIRYFRRSRKFVLAWLKQEYQVQI